MTLKIKQTGVISCDALNLVYETYNQDNWQRATNKLLAEGMVDALELVVAMSEMCLNDYIDDYEASGDDDLKTLIKSQIEITRQLRNLVVAQQYQADVKERIPTIHA